MADVWTVLNDYRATLKDIAGRPCSAQLLGGSKECNSPSCTARHALERWEGVNIERQGD